MYVTASYITHGVRGCKEERKVIHIMLGIPVLSRDRIKGGEHCLTPFSCSQVSKCVSRAPESLGVSDIDPHSSLHGTDYCN